MPWKRFKAKFRQHFEEVLKTKKGLRNIALGFSIGTFISLLPTPGLNILLGFLVILTFPSISKYALFASYFVFNGLTKTPLYIFSLWLGTKILGNGHELVWTGNLVDLGTMLSKGFILGVLIVDVVLTIISYHFAFHFVKYCKRELKHKENQ